MKTIVSKSQLKTHLLEYLRFVEQEKKPLIVTHVGKPVATITPYRKNPETLLSSLRGSVLSYIDPMKPVGEDEWEQLT